MGRTAQHLVLSVLPQTIPHSFLLRLLLCSCCTATREHADRHGTGLFLAEPGNEAAEEPELPQERRAIAEDAVFRINRLTTTLTTMRPDFTGADEKMNEYQKIFVQFAEYVNLRNNEDSEGVENDELGRYSTTKHEDEQNESKEYSDSKKVNQNNSYDTTGEIFDLTCLLDVSPKTTVKNDDYKKFYGQFAECLKPGIHVNFADDVDTTEQARCNALNLEDEQIRSKEYIGNKMESQNDNYDITGERAS